MRKKDFKWDKFRHCKKLLNKYETKIHRWKLNFYEKEMRDFVEIHAWWRVAWLVSLHFNVQCIVLANFSLLFLSGWYFFVTAKEIEASNLFYPTVNGERWN